MKRLMDIIQKKLCGWGIDSTCWVDDMVLFLGPDQDLAETRANQASAEADRLRRLELPAYILDTGGSRGEAFAVYSGAFESEDAAGPLGGTLREAGVDAELTVRKGASR